MSEAVPANHLSPAFGRAQQMSRILSTLLRIGFWITALVGTGLVCIAFLSGIVWPLWPFPADSVVSYNSPQIRMTSLSFLSHVGVATTWLAKFGPISVALHFGHRTFSKFARGQVFAAATIADMRSAAAWIVVAAIATSFDQFIFNLAVGQSNPGPRAFIFAFDFWRGSFFNLSMLLLGLCTYVAAYVMAEARRIADDNASFV